MYPMTPLQSWSFLVLIFLLVICIAWLIHELVSPRPEEHDAPQLTLLTRAQDDADTDETPEREQPRPRLTLITGTGAQRAARPVERSPLYDWAEHGL